MTWPRSLLGQTLLSTTLIVVVAQACSLVLFYLLALRPALLQVAQVTAQSVAVLADTVARVPPAEQGMLVRRLSAGSVLRIWNGAAPPDDLGPRPRPVERLFMRALARTLAERGAPDWRIDHARRLWVRVPLGEERYWISIRTEPPRATGALLGSTVAAILLALAASWLVYRRVLRPLHALNRATDSYRLGAPLPPLDEDGPREVAQLSRSFNGMTRRLAQADADRAIVLAGISHDVRTPLAKLKLALAIMRHEDEALRDSAQRQVDAIDRILSQFMAFARGFQAEAIALADPNALLEELAADPERDIRVLPLQPSVLLRCRPEALRRAMGNLLENALTYGNEPVQLSAQATATELYLAVRDHGGGVPAVLLSTLAEPFVRGDPARGQAGGSGGTGLGLAIAERVAQLHCGRLLLENLPDGFRATLVLPAAIANAVQVPGTASTTTEPHRPLR
ncbi:two-component system osmolarity sensor histidine kinase EnvZ [Pseudoduganella lurida]|uniref:histidine kinase n=1 Tax=Pseudoduganella lurida TaxID=1036180 RepID=A0A562R5F1_9BURK|nr:ATP-binding protein [Pseudoduganella lurida]TWI64299.1 two-component system osmolarity sensor histidine kinase EnvZ [Pseudoduganella lurida]